MQSFYFHRKDPEHCLEMVESSSLFVSSICRLGPLGATRPLLTPLPHISSSDDKRDQHIVHLYSTATYFQSCSQNKKISEALHLKKMAHYSDNTFS